jgi:hypothetical protein
MQHDFCRFRIDVEIELGRRRHVADPVVGAAHDPQVPDRLGDPRLLQIGKRDVGERRLRQNGDLAGILHDRVDDDVDRVPLLRPLPRLGEIAVAHAVPAEHIGGVDRLAQHRQPAAGIDRHGGAPTRRLQRDQRVFHLLVEGDIAVADGQRLQRRRGMFQGQKDGKAVVAGGVGVDDEPHDGTGIFCPSVNCGGTPLQARASCIAQKKKAGLGPASLLGSAAQLQQYSGGGGMSPGNKVVPVTQVK